MFLHPNFRFKENKDNCEKRYSTIVNKHKKDWEWDFQITTFRPSNIQMLKTIVDVEKYLQISNFVYSTDALWIDSCLNVKSILRFV